MSFAIGSNLGGVPRAVTTPAHSRTTVEKAMEFEGMLINQCLEKLQQSFVGAGTGEGDDPAQSTLSGMGTMAMAQGLAQRGGLGIARMLLQHLPEDKATDVTNVISRGVNPGPAAADSKDKLGEK
jgi:Rod binding domain-containing protein